MRAQHSSPNPAPNLQPPQGKPFPKLLAGVALVLVLSIPVWRLGQKVPSQNPGLRTPAPSKDIGGRPSVQQLQSLSGPSRRQSVPASDPTQAWLRGFRDALDRIEISRDWLQQNEALETLARRVPLSGMAAALELLSRAGSTSLEEDLKLRLIRRWAGADPRAAADYLTAAPVDRLHQEAVNDVAIAWANVNVAEATDWAQGLPEGEQRDGALLNVAYEAARADAVAALHLAMELPMGEGRDDLITHAAGQWAATTPEAALEWARQIVAPELRARVLSAIATVWSETDPVAAGALAVKELSAGKQQDDAIVGVVQRWVQREPEAAAAWVVDFPDGSLRDTALEELVKLWSDQDTAAAAAWIKQSPLSQPVKERLSALRPG
jgi:hypothetical protein